MAKMGARQWRQLRQVPPTAGHWLSDRAGVFGSVDGSVGGGFEAYAAVRHLADHPASSYNSGVLDPITARRISDAITRYDPTAPMQDETHVAGLWQGWGNPDLPREESPKQLLSLPGRRYLLFAAALADLSGLVDIDNQSAGLFFPLTHDWCVATDVDMRATLIAGPQSLIDQILELPSAVQCGEHDRLWKGWFVPTPGT